MEKNNDNKTSSESLGVCEKLFAAIKVSPAFKIVRRISYRPIRDPTPTDNSDHRRVIEMKTKPSSASDHPQQKTGKTGDHVQAVPIDFVYTGTAASNTNNNVAVEKELPKKNDVVALHEKRKPKAEIISSQRKKKPESSSTTTDHHDPMNATFTDYINKVGTRFRTTPKSDGGDHQKKS